MTLDVVLGDGSLRSFRLTDVSSVVVRQNNGTPIMVAAEVGDGRTQQVAHVKDADFHRVLRQLGVSDTVICDTLLLPPPPLGARLLTGPDV